MNARGAVDYLSGVLVSVARSAGIPEEQDVYGWLVGSWELEVLHYWAMDVSARGLKGEVHAAWVLEGRAVQDVWLMPPRSERSGTLDRKFNMFGTTLRVWDGTLQAWRISWRNPAGDHHEDQIGKRVGAEVVQTGVRPDGTRTRWRFIEIERDSFHWLGEAQEKNGWRLEGEFRAKRLGQYPGHASDTQSIPAEVSKTWPEIQ